MNEIKTMKKLTIENLRHDLEAIGLMDSNLRDGKCLVEVDDVLNIFKDILTLSHNQALESAIEKIGEYKRLDLNREKIAFNDGLKCSQELLLSLKK